MSPGTRTKLLKQMNVIANRKLTEYLGSYGIKLSLSLKPLTGPQKIDNLLKFAIHIHLNLKISSNQYCAEYKDFDPDFRKSIQDALTYAGKKAMKTINHTCPFSFSIYVAGTKKEIVCLTRQEN